MFPKLSAAFYAQKGSDPPSQPVRDWLKKLAKEERTEVGGDIQSVQFGWPLGMPLVKHLQGDLWEVRTQLASRIARVIFAVEGNTMYLLMALSRKRPKQRPQIWHWHKSAGSRSSHDSHAAKAVR